MPVLAIPLLGLIASVQAELERPPVPPSPHLSPPHPQCAPPSAASDSGVALPPIPGLAIAGIPFDPSDIAGADQTFDGYSFQPVVSLTFSESGHRKFLDLQQGCIGQALPIRLDGELLSEPHLVEPIEGPEIMISGNFTVEEASALAGRLARRPSPD